MIDFLMHREHRLGGGAVWPVSQRITQHLMRDFINGRLVEQHEIGRMARQGLHRRFAKNGAKTAAVALAHTILVIVWHVLTNDTPYTDLGSDYYTRRDDPEARKQRLLRQLQDLGYTVELTPAA